jgi:hypothetical protein
MFGFTRLGVDPPGLPPLWFAPDAEIPTGWVRVEAPASPVKVSLSTAGVATVHVLPGSPVLNANWSNAPATATVTIGAFVPQIQAGSHTPSGTAAVTAKLGRIGPRDCPPVVTVPTTAALGAVVQKGVVPLATRTVTALLPGSGAGPPGLLATVAVSTAGVEMGLWTFAPSGVVSVQGQTPGVSVTQVCPEAAVTATGTLGIMGIQHRTPRALVWAVPGSAWEWPLAQAGTVTVLNSTTLAVSEYSLAAIDVAVVEGEVQFLTARGVVKLSGDIEAEAVPVVQTGKLNLTPGKDCVVHPLRVLAASKSALELVVETDRDGEAQTATYAVPAARSTQERERVVPMGKGAYGSGWSFKLKSLAGRAAPWSASAASIEIFNTKRRL